MNRKGQVLVIGLISLIVVSLGVVFAIHRFGEQRVAAFGSVMSFIAAAVAAIAAVGYLFATSEMVAAVRVSAEEQARVARIMEADLHYRIEPHLQFRILGGSVSDMPAVVENIGRGVAKDVIGIVTYRPSQRKQELPLRGWIEPNKERRVKVGQQTAETGYSVELSCTDSVGLTRYNFTLNPSGELTITQSQGSAAVVKPY